MLHAVLMSVILMLVIIIKPDLAITFWKRREKNSFGNALRDDGWGH